MASMVQIGAFGFYADNPIGCTLGYNAAHGTDIHFFQDLIACSGTRVRLNIKPDLYCANNISASPSTWNWGFVDAVVQMANQNNIRCTMIARGFTPSNNTTFASWQENTSCAPGFTQTTIAGYTKIAVALARRYNGDGNPDNAKDSSGNALQADCIEIGNEEINSMQDSSGYPYTGCRKAMRYVGLVRTVMAQLRAPSSSGGGGWVPRGNFLARVGAWGIVHDQPNEITSTYGILTSPVLDATYNPSANSSSIFGFDASIGPTGTQLLDYANHHNYNAASGGGLSPAGETTQIRGILNAAGNTSIPIWCTEAGWPGPCAGSSESAQATYFAANADGSGGGMLQALKDAGCQHWDIFTLNYWDATNTSGGKYIGQADSIACLTTASGSPPNTYVRFQAHARVAAYMTNIDKGAWASQAIPSGFGGSTSPPPPPPPPGPPPPPPPPPMTTVATDTFTRANAASWGTASDLVDTWVNTNETGTPTLSIASNEGKITGSASAAGVELLGTLVETDCDAVVRTATTSSGDGTSVILRSNSGGTVYYRASLSGGNLTCHYFDGTTQNSLYSHAVTYTAGIANFYWIRFRIIGTTLQARFWASGTTEPSDFTNASYAFTIIDTNLTSGKFGVRARVNTTSDIILFDSFTASSFNGTSPPPPPPGNTPQLTGGFTPLASQTINLTTEGAGDWAHWGLSSGTTYDHKSTGGSQIANFTTVGNGAAIQNNTALNSFTWIDGTPDSTATATATGSKINPGASGSAGAYGASGQASTPHVCMIFLENHSYNNTTAKYVIGNPALPLINGYTTTYSTCTNFYGVTHQSLPNYLALASGSDQGGLPDTYNPQSAPLAGNTLVDSLKSAGIAWKHYAENLPSTGYLNGDTGSGSTLYVQHHNPWVYFKTVRNNSAQYNNIVNYTQLATDLGAGTAPPIFFVEPSNSHNGHPPSTDANVDTFVSGLVTTIQASTWYTANNGIIILWFDESNPDTDVAGIGDKGSNTQYPHGGHTVCIVISANNSANVLSSNLNHYGVLHAINNLYGLSPLGNDAHTINGDLTPLLVGNGGSPPPPPGPPPPPPPPPPTSSNLGNGFKFTVPADTNQRTINVYVDANQGVGTLAASLSDDSAVDYYDSSLANKTAASAGQYTLTYAAASSNQSLQVLYTLSDGTTPGTAKSSDTFNRANQSGLGTASDSETYQLVTESGTPSWSILSNQAKLTGSAGGDTSVALLSSGTLQDCESVMIVNLSNLANLGGLVLRSASSATSYYVAYLTQSTIVIAYVTGGIATLLVDEPATLKINTNYWLRFRILKNSLYARYWPNDGTKEPTNWHAMTVDRTLESAGQYGFRGAIATTSDTVLLDTYSIVDLTSNNDPSYVSLYAADMPTVITTASGALSGVITTPSSPVDLTTEGTGDWTHWGYSSATSIERKLGVTQLISNFTSIGSGSPTQNVSGIMGYSWEDGTPDGTITNSTTESDVQGVANGFSLTVPADTNSRTINVYVGAKNAQGTLTATLSDGSATAYTDTSLNDGGSGTVKEYAITYSAASANQTLTITWVMLVDNGGAGTTSTYSTDTFTRANGSGFGTSSGGEIWTHTNAVGTAVTSIASNTGQVTATAIASSVDLLGTQTQANAEALVRWQMSSIGDTAGLILRALSTNQFYRIEANAGNSLAIYRNASGTVTALQTATISFVANTLYWLRFRINGSNLYGKFWANGSAEPTAWTLTATDTGASAIAGAGQWGLRTRINSNGNTVKYDSYTVTSLPTGGTPGNISLQSATVPLLITQGPPPPPPPPPGVNTTITVNATDKIVPNTWQGLGVQQDAYLGANYKATVLANGPIRYYRLDEISGTVANDLGSQAQNGTYTGGYTQGHTGLITNSTDGAVLFNGTTGYLALPTAGLPSGASPFSIEYWLNATVGQPDGHAALLFGTFAAAECVALYYTPSLGFLNLYTGTSTNTANNTVVTGTTYHLAITYDGTTLILWVNGVNAAQKTITLNLIYGIAYIANDPYSEPVGGIYDEVAVYNYALSPAQITADYTAGTFLGLTTTQRTLINERLNYMNPPLIRTCADSIAWWCPTGVVGTYDFYNPLMQEWYQVFENAQAQGISVIVGVNSPAPFTPLSNNWCTAFAALIDQLVNNLGYTCIKYVSGLSEPDTM